MNIYLQLLSNLASFGLKTCRVQPLKGKLPIALLAWHLFKTKLPQSGAAGNSCEDGVFISQLL
jgi:hypothetical protein